MIAADRSGRLLTTDGATAVVLLALGLLYGREAWQEGVGTLSETGAGFFPALVAAALVVSAGIVVLQELGSPGPSRLADEDDGDFQGEVHWWRIVGVLLASLTVPLVGDQVGFVVAASVSFVAVAKIMGLPGWRRPLILGVAFGATVWLVFVQWLFVPLPAGHLGLA